MSKFKGTPGPWRIQHMGPETNETDFWITSDQNLKGSKFETDIMCDDYGEHNGYPREQRLADAKAIAQVPVMIRAFELIVEKRNSESWDNECCALMADEILRKIYDGEINE